MTRKLLFSLRRPEPEAPQEGADKQWHAVEIRHGRHACEAVCLLEGERYLSAEAPLLPLRECDRRSHCECRYRHHADRRAGPRRTSEGAAPTSLDDTRSDRRRLTGRRLEDQIQWVEDEEESSIDLADTYYKHVNRASFNK